MMVFQELNFDPVKEILKIRCRIYILMKKKIILQNIHVKTKSFAPPQKETKHVHSSAADLLHTVLEQEISIDANARSSHWRCSAKKVFFKMSQNSEETPVAEKTPVNFAKFLRTTFLQNNFRPHKTRDIDCICCRELDAMLIASVKIPECKGSISPSSFYGHLLDYQSLYQFYLPDR